MKYYGVDKHAVKTACFFAFKLINSHYFNIDDREDIIQELILEYLLNEDKYNASKGTREAFISHIMKIRAVDMIRDKRAIFRGGKYNFVSIESAMENNHLEFEGDDFVVDEVKIDLRKIMSKLDGDELILAHFFIQGFSINEIIKKMKIGKSKFYRLMDNIKKKTFEL